MWLPFVWVSVSVHVYACVCACVRLCLRAGVCRSACACVHAHWLLYVSVFESDGVRGVDVW